MALPPVPAFAALLGLALGSGVALPAPPSARVVSYVGTAMGTRTRIAIVTADSAASAAEAARGQAVFARLDSLMTNWTESSEVARINREAGHHPTVIDPEVARVIQTSLDVWRQSEGANDITVEPLVRAWGFLGGRPHVPSDSVAAVAFQRVGAARLRFDPATRTLGFTRPDVRIDLGGIAKGYAVDRVAATLRESGVTQALVDISGNMMALGAPPGSDSWRIGVRDPRDRLPYFARVQLSGRAISTSGKYEQFVAADGKSYGHIMDPRTGRPADGLISVTVVAGTAMDCDAWDTPLFVLGLSDAMRIAREREDISVILVAPSESGRDQVWVEKSLRADFELIPEASPWFEVRYF
jgi:thiamine biosynthesis lipoprotein